MLNFFVTLASSSGSIEKSLDECIDGKLIFNILTKLNQNITDTIEKKRNKTRAQYTHNKWQSLMSLLIRLLGSLTPIIYRSTTADRVFTMKPLLL